MCCRIRLEYVFAVAAILKFKMTATRWQFFTCHHTLDIEEHAKSSNTANLEAGACVGLYILPNLGLSITPTLQSQGSVIRRWSDQRPWYVKTIQHRNLHISCVCAFISTITPPLHLELKFTFKTYWSHNWLISKTSVKHIAIHSPKNSGVWDPSSDSPIVILLLRFNLRNSYMLQSRTETWSLDIWALPAFTQSILAYVGGRQSLEVKR